MAEYALSGIDKPIGVAEYQLLRDLPETLGRNLPSIAEIEAELSGELAATGRKGRSGGITSAPGIQIISATLNG